MAPNCFSSARLLLSVWCYERKPKLTKVEAAYAKKSPYASIVIVKQPAPVPKSKSMRGFIKDKKARAGSGSKPPKSRARFRLQGLKTKAMGVSSNSSSFREPESKSCISCVLTIRDFQFFYTDFCIHRLSTLAPQTIFISFASHLLLKTFQISQRLLCPFYFFQHVHFRSRRKITSARRSFEGYTQEKLIQEFGNST